MKPSCSPHAPLRLVGVALTLFAVTVQPIDATWSIVATDTATGEVGLAGATCLPGADIKGAIAVVRVGKGAAAAQSFVDQSGKNRVLIFDAFAAGTSPKDMLALLAASDGGHQTRQYGIVDLANAPATFTGSAAGPAKKGVAGKLGTIRYAIQGNVLAGQQVVNEAEKAFLASTGDLSQRLLAAMEAARAFGGDGRCSCSISVPNSCGSPPPTPFKSAHVAFIALARMGDVDGTCNGAIGCANGSYYVDLDVLGGVGDPDPVVRLAQKYGVFRTALAGHPDHILSSVEQGAAALPADGQTSTQVTVRLADVEGNAIATGGASVGVTRASGATAATQIGPVVDNGDGSYTFALTAGTQLGTDELVIVVDDGALQAQLFPNTSVRLEPAAPLHVGFDALSAAAGGAAPFTIDFGPTAAGLPYILLGSAAGTSPGQPFGGIVVPLQSDPLFVFSLTAPGPPFLPGSLGLLDASGRGTARLDVPPGALAPLVGLHTDWASVAIASPARVTNAVGVDVLP